MHKTFIVHIFDSDIWGVGTNESEAREMSLFIAKEVAEFCKDDETQENTEEVMRKSGYCIDVTVSGNSEDELATNARIILSNAKFHKNTGVEDE